MWADHNCIHNMFTNMDNDGPSAQRRNTLVLDPPPLALALASSATTSRYCRRPAPTPQAPTYHSNSIYSRAYLFGCSKHSKSSSLLRKMVLNGLEWVWMGVNGFDCARLCPGGFGSTRLHSSGFQGPQTHSDVAEMSQQQTGTGHWPRGAPR